MSLVASSLWARAAKNTDCSTGPLARPFAHSLDLLTRSVAPHYSLCSRAPLRSLARSLAHFAHSRTRGTVNDSMGISSVFFSILAHSGTEGRTGRPDLLPIFSRLFYDPFIFLLLERISGCYPEFNCQRSFSLCPFYPPPSFTPFFPFLLPLSVYDSS